MSIRPVSVSDQQYVDFKGDMTCPSKDSIIKPRTGVFAVCICQGALLLIKEKDHNQRWELPGGGIDPGEDFTAALCREVYEESGLDIPFSVTADHVDYHQKINFYARDVGEFWDYDQYYFRPTDIDLKDYVFDGLKTSPDGGKSQWLSLSEIDRIQIKHTNLAVLKTLQIIK
jgi:8-oxo-dGTP pyrophosphatase MutT (NUDIX family)